MALQLEGCIRAARIAVAAGAYEVGTQQFGVEKFKVDPELGVDDPRCMGQHGWGTYGCR